MKELYIEGVATHDDPESCVDVREGAGEALTGAIAGWVLSREISQFRTPRSLSNPKATRPADLASGESRRGRGTGVTVVFAKRRGENSGDESV
jgi:hypothetical protein